MERGAAACLSTFRGTRVHDSDRIALGEWFLLSSCFLRDMRTRVYLGQHNIWMLHHNSLHRVRVNMTLLDLTAMTACIYYVTSPESVPKQLKYSTRNALKQPIPHRSSLVPFSYFLLIWIVFSRLAVMKQGSPQRQMLSNHLLLDYGLSQTQGYPAMGERGE